MQSHLLFSLLKDCLKLNILVYRANPYTIKYLDKLPERARQNIKEELHIE